MRRTLPPLSVLPAFEATARLGSVTLAAAELGRTHGAISRQLRLLQDQAGVALFDKAGTGLRLNRQGEALLRVVTEALDGLERGYRRMRDDARGPAVHVACSATFAIRWLVPRLVDFYRRHPEVTIRLSMTSAREIRDEGADLVLTWDRLSSPVWDADRAIALADVAFGPVCAPAHPARLEGGRLTLATRILHEHAERNWLAWERRAGLRVEAGADIAFQHTHLCIAAALTGLGVALVERRLVAADLAAGALIAPCGFVPFEQGFAAIPTSDRALRPAGAAFIAWLRESLNAEADPIPAAAPDR